MMDEFSQILIHFYRHLIRKHPSKAQLINKVYCLLHIVTHQQHQHTSPSISSSSKPKNQYILSPTKNTNCNVSLRQSAKLWNCSWQLVRPQLSKILSYVILSHLAFTQNFWQFQRIRQEFKQRIQRVSFFQENSNRISQQLSRLSKLFFRNKDEVWQTTLLELFQKMPPQLDKHILQCYNLAQVDTCESGQLKQSLKHLSFKLKIKIHYFQINCNQIVINDIYGLSQFQYIFGFIDTINNYVVASSFPELDENDKMRVQTLQNFQINIDEMLQKYEQSNKKLNQIGSAKNYVQVQGVKELFNTKK